MRKRKVEIVLETERLIVRSRKQKLRWCEQCSVDVLLLTPSEAAALARTTARQIFRRVEAGEVHFLETAEGGLLICRNSLEK